MAEKRCSEAAGSVAYSKLPRLEADPGHILAAGLCRSGGPPGHATDARYSYQGTYFGYPLQCHESPELSVQWCPAEPCVSCTDGAVNQQLRPDRAHCMLYRQESEGFGRWVQNPSYEKNRDCLVGETLAAPEKWANYVGHTDFIRQSWIQGFPSPHSAQAPAGCPPLAFPRPVYRNHVYCTDAGCSPKGSPASRTPAESPSKRSADLERALPSSGHPLHASCGSAATTTAPVAESGFLPLHQSWKDPVAPAASFSPYRKMFEHLQVAPSASLADAGYPAGCDNRKSVPGECARSPCGKAWSKLPPPASPLAVPQGLLYQERSSSCYPLPSYPLTSHEQLGFYQQSIAQAEKQNALFALPACRNFNYPASEEPKLLPRTYCPPAPRSYYPSHLESYFYRTRGPSPVTSPGLKTSREYVPQPSFRSDVSFEQRNPTPACSVTEKTSRGSSAPCREGAQNWSRANGVAKPTDESFQCWQSAPQPCAFQLLHPVERLPSCIDGYGRTQEDIYGAGRCQLEKGPSYAEKPSGLSSEDKKKDAGKTPQSGACIVIPDSPMVSHDSCLKRDSLRARISEGPDSSVQHVLQPPDKELKDLKQPEDPPPPSSPPMPVIHNVFSLAPYRDYLEGSTASLQLPSSKGCPTEKPSLEKTWHRAEGDASPRPPSAGLSKTPGVLLDRGQEIARNAVAEGGRKDPSGSCIVMERESRGSAGFCESYRTCQNAPATSLRAMDCSRELSKDSHVLDLSFKAGGLANVPHVQRLAGKTEALEREDSQKNGEEVNEGLPKEREAIQDTNSPALQLLHKSSSEEKGNFQSSAAFLYKKFKILKSHAAGSGSPMQQNFPLFPSASQIAALSNNFCLQQGSEQAAARQNSLPVQQSGQQAATQQNSLPLQQSGQQAATRQNSLPLQQSGQQAATQQNSLPLQQSCQQAATRQNSLPLQQSFQQMVTRQNSLPVQQSSQQVTTRRNSLPAQQSFQLMVTRQKSLPTLQIAHENSVQPNTKRLSRKCLNSKQPDASKLLPPTAPAGSPALGEASAPLPPGCESPTQQASSKQYFTALHASVCAAISDSVSASSPELLREWLEKAEPERDPKPKAGGSAKAKSGPKPPGAPKPSPGQRVWLAFEGVAGLLNQLLSQLGAFLLAHSCPFPHVVRAGAIFVPIHVVKEKLFGGLPGASVDQVLQEHKVELRPTTLSEEKLLRELELKACTSRMLKLLALKQLPDIYPDLLDRHWYHCVKQQLGTSSQAALNASKNRNCFWRDEAWIYPSSSSPDPKNPEKGEPAEEIRNGAAEAEILETVEVSACLQSATRAFSLGARGKREQGRKWESAPQGEALGSPSKTHGPFNNPQGPPSSSFSQRRAVLTQTKGLPEEDAASVVVRTKRCPLRSGAKRLLFRARRLSGTLRVKLTDQVARGTSKLLRLRKSVVRIQFGNAPREKPGRPVLAGKKQKRPASLLLKRFRRRRAAAGGAPPRPGYPELVGKRIRHLYEEKDKSEAWYRGVVLRVHKRHRDPLKTVYEVKYDSEPEWQYYLEILQDYKEGWLEVDE